MRRWSTGRSTCCVFCAALAKVSGCTVSAVKQTGKCDVCGWDNSNVVKCAAYLADTLERACKGGQTPSARIFAPLYLGALAQAGAIEIKHGHVSISDVGEWALKLARAKHFAPGKEKGSVVTF